MIEGVDIVRMEGPPFRGFDEMTAAIVAFNKQVVGYMRETGFIAALLNDEAVGGISLRWYGPDAYIDFFGVDEKYRRQGIGTRLIEAAETCLVEQQCAAVFVDTLSFQAPDFYKRMGYKVIATTPKHFCGYDRLTLRKDLND